MNKIDPIICVFGSYDESVLSNRVILMGLPEVVNTTHLRTVHAGVPKAVIYDPKHLGAGQILGRVWNRVSAQLRLLAQIRYVIGSDVVLVLPFGLIDLIQAFFYKLFFGMKVIYVPQNSLYDLFTYASGKDKNSSIREWVIFKFEQILWRVPDLILFNSELEAQQHKDMLELPTIRTGVIPLGADDLLFFPGKERKSTKTTEVLFYGEYNLAQGTDIIVQAAALLQKNTSIHFTMIGEGKQKETTLALAKEKKVPNVTFLTWQAPDVLRTYIHKADIVLGMLADTDVTQRVVPNKVYQALACKKAVITADSVAGKTFLTDKKHVYFVKPDDPKALASAVNYLSAHPSARTALATNGYKQFVTHFAPVPVAQKLVQQIKETL